MASLTTSFFQKILLMEGGFQNHPADNGNYACGNLVGTKYGVSAVAYSTWVGHCATVSEIEGMSKDTAYNFYAWYFDLYKNFQIGNQTLFELSANNTMGNPTQAAKCEQRALRGLGYDVDVDGNRGPQTIAALNAAVQEHGLPAIYNEVRAEWIKFVGTVPTWGAQLVARVDKHFPPLDPGDGNPGDGIGIGLMAGGLLLLYFLTRKN